MPQPPRVAVYAFVHAALVAAAAASVVSAQAPTQMHYAASVESQLPAPDGQLAPRLQNLGTHVFPVTTTRAAGAAASSTRASTSPTRSTTPKPAAPSARRRDSTPVRDGLLGPGARARAEHQRRDGPERRAARARTRAEGASPEGERLAARAGLHRGAGRALLGQARAPRGARPGLRRGDAAVLERFPDDLDAAMLYVESMMDLRPWDYWMRDGRPQEGTAESRRAHRVGDASATRGTPARCTSTST